MPFDRFLIAPINTGLETDLRPWLIPDDAFPYLQNAYVFRGRVRKRFGSILMGTTQLNSRLRISLGTNTNMAMDLPANTTVHAAQLAIGQMFSLGTDTFYVYQLGAGVATLSTNAGISATIDSTASPNTVTFTGGALVPVYWYPSLPVMGLTQYESGAINNHPAYAFDTEFAYLFTGGAWARSGSGTAPVWNGGNLNFFWATNWQGSTTTAATQPVMFVTNFQVTNLNGAGALTDDPIWFTQDGSTWKSITTTATNGFYFLPAGGARTSSPFVVTSRIILPFKNRLILLNTVENNNSAGFGAGTNSNYPQRCRYSFNGSPLANNAWYEPNQEDAAGAVAAGAGFIDAATDEQIISAEFIKDRLIVYFERSTWELAYTGNEILPFVWQKINTELGSQSTFSTVPFDKAVLTVGNTGIHACNGANVERIDNKIPDEIFEFELRNNATQRIAGIRDYIAEMVYWAIPFANETPTQTYPNQILVYNYKNGSWALNTDCFTAFGYFEQQSDMTWASSSPLTWAQSNFAWNGQVTAAQARQVIAGTPEGFVVIIEPLETSRNAPAMQITNIIYAATGIITLNIINHNFSFNDDNIAGAYILMENIVGDATTQTVLNGTIALINSIVDANNITIDTNYLAGGPLTSGTYNGGGTGSRVSNVQIYSKQFNPYVSKDRNVYLHRIDFAVQRTAAGQITVDYYPSATELSMIEEGTSTGMIMGNNILETSPYPANLYPLEQYQERLWHPIYFQSTGECIQIVMYFSEAQMTNPAIALEDFELEAMILYTQPSSARLQ